VPWLFGRYEFRIGQLLNSPSLLADATEFRAHVLSSGIVFAGLAGQFIGWQFDRFAALLISLWIVRAGWETLTDSMRVLLDASLDVDTLQQVRQLIARQPAVVAVNSVTGRNAGRYRFIETEISVRVRALDKAHQVSHALEAAIRTHVPHVERALVHVEPARQEVRRVAVPLADHSDAVSRHFGTALSFALVEIRTADGSRENQMTITNPYAADPRGRGLKVAQWLLEQGIDVLITADDIREKGPGYALGDAGVAIIISEAATLAAALTASVGQQGPSEQTSTLPKEEHSDQVPRVDLQEE
ncbi:MAG: cation diffusion facilitator family transporter, partial [Candidatus Binatia bacterium]